MNSTVTRREDGPATPFFIFGSPRSGTTLLERILNRHSAIFIPPETAFFFRLKLSGFSRRPFSVKNARAFMAYYLDSRPARLLKLREFGAEGRLLDGAKSYREIFERLLRLLADGTSKRVLGEKTPHHLRCMDIIRPAFPCAPLIAVVRDGRAVVNSRLRHPNWENNTLTAAWHWRDDARQLTRLMDRESSDKLLLVRYEDLLVDPASEMRRIVSHLAIPYEASMLRDGSTTDHRFSEYYDQSWMVKSTRGVDVSRADAWKKDLSDAQLRLVENETERELALFGYERITAGRRGVFVPRVAGLVKHYAGNVRRRLLPAVRR